ncbi:MAG: hypothetical protein IJH57_05900 [Mogibacterium sp.]|nr:hypothetical protein [Mogibacterium sp.]
MFYAEASKPNKEKSVTSKSNKITIKGLKKGKTYIVWYRPIKKLKGKDYLGIRLPKKVKVK